MGTSPRKSAGTAVVRAIPTWEHAGVTSPEDPERRIAELEKQVADARRIADLERQLAEARSAARGFTPWQGFAAGNVADAPTPPVNAHLSVAPRRIPGAFLLAEALPFRWWYVFTLFMVAITPIALWTASPTAAGLAAVAVLALIYGYQFWTARKRLALLKWGRVATVVGTEIVSRATYYSGTTWSNVWLPQAHGWTVTRELWSGRNTKTRVRYTLDGYQGELRISGRSYDDGVILADERHPERALCVSSFAYDLDRDESGNWVGRLRPRLMVGMVVWTAIVGLWVVGAVILVAGVANDVFATRLPRGGTGSVSSSDTVYCNDGHLEVGGIDSVVTVRGHCASLDVSGIDNVVTIDSVDLITIGGIDNRVTYHSGSPRYTPGSSHATRG
jgi:hypothetical protein